MRGPRSSTAGEPGDVHLEVEGDDFYLDLLFYHLKLRCYVVFELKATDFKPEYAGRAFPFRRRLPREAAERFEQAGIATADQALASLKRCRPGRAPIHRDVDDAYPQKRPGAKLRANRRHEACCDSPETSRVRSQRSTPVRIETQDPRVRLAMDLDRIAIKGLRSLRDVQLDFGPRTVLIGANGSGKSNVLAAFDLLGALREGRLRRYSAKHGGADSLFWFGSKMTDQIQLDVSFGSGTNGYRIELVADSSDQLEVAEESCWFWDKAHHDRPYDEGLIGEGSEAGISQRHDEKVVTYVQSWLDGIRSFHFHDTSDSSPLRRLSDVHDTRALRSDGSNLAAYLRFLKLKHAETYSWIRDTVRRVAPFFDDFVLEPQRENEGKILLAWLHTDRDHYFNAASLSDGTLRFIAMATLLLQPAHLRPSAIVLDEPELGLHPLAVTALASMVTHTSTETQVILATQSPQLLDHFEPSDIVVAEASQQETRLQRVDAASLEVWLEDYSLGQLWEKNQFGGRPGARS